MRNCGRMAGLLIAAAVAASQFAGCNGRANLGPVADAASVKTIREAISAGKSGGAEKKAGPVGTGWATLKGQFVYEGNPPAMKPYDVNKEPEFCTENGKVPLQETLLVDDQSKGIKNVLIFLRDASRVHDSALPKKDSIVFDQKHCVFLTHVIGTTVGQTVNIKNSDQTGHNTNIIGTGDNPTIPAGGMVAHPVQKDATTPFLVKCGIHPWMTAYMLQWKNGYFAVTDKDGKFEIPNVPAGEPLEFQVWHESGAAPGNGLKGETPGDADIKWTDRGRINVTLKENQPKEIKVTVAPKAFTL